MKNLVLALSILFSVPTFAGEVITCDVDSTESIRVDKVNGKYFYSVNGKKAKLLDSAQTIQAKDFKGESTLLGIMDHIGINPKELSRVNAYSLSKDGDGGRTIIRFIYKNETYFAIIVSMGSIKPCY